MGTWGDTSVPTMKFFLPAIVLMLAAAITAEPANTDSDLAMGEQDSEGLAANIEEDVEASDRWAGSCKAIYKWNKGNPYCRIQPKLNMCGEKFYPKATPRKCICYCRRLP